MSDAIVKKQLMDELETVKTKSEVCSFFSRYDIKAVDEKIKWLRDVMGVTEVYYATDSNEEISDDECTLTDEMTIFLQGDWRMFEC